MKFTAYVARAFCHDSLGGNPAGVVFVEKESQFSQVDMQLIAKQLNFSETAFISTLESGSYKARYFTPSSEIEFCGHATLAAFGVLKKLKSLKDAVYDLDTPVGRCEVTLKDRMVFLSQQLPEFGETIDQSEIHAIFRGAVFQDEPCPRIVSTGLRDIFVRVKDKECLQALKPDLSRMSQLNKRTSSVGIHVFALNASGSVITAHCRNFAPLYGIDEESATGSSNGALACHLFNEGLLPHGALHQLLFRQGESLNAPSDIYVHLCTHEEVIEKVECGGEVFVDEERELQVP